MKGQKNLGGVLITGGAGFIGSRLAVALSTVADVHVFDNFHPQVHSGNPENAERLKASKIKIIKGDVRSAEDVAGAVQKAKPLVVYHLAAETGTGQSFDLVSRYNDVNIMGTAHLIEALRAHAPSCQRVILAGSRSVYGEGACVNSEGMLTPAVERLDADLKAGDFNPKDKSGNPLTPVATNADCVVAPASIYASTKLMQEYLLSQAFWGSATKVGILRLQNVYGPGQSLNNPYTGVLSIFCRQILEGKSLNIFEDGDITRDFVFVDDVVAAFCKMGVVDVLPSGIVDIGSGEAATIKRVAENLLVLLGQPANNYTVTGAYRPGDIRYALADIERAKDELGWTPQVSLKAGLDMLAQWSKSNLGV